MNKDTQARLRNFIERVENVEAEKKALTQDVKDIYAQAKSEGFIVPAMREIVKRRKKDPTEQATHDELVDVYMRAVTDQLEMFDDVSIRQRKGIEETSRVDRLKGLGNAVVPQIPEIIGRAILEAEESRCQS